MSELESLGLETPKLNELNDSYEVGNLVDNLKQMLFVEYKSMPLFTDWRMEPDNSIFAWAGILDHYFIKILSSWTRFFDTRKKQMILLTWTEGSNFILTEQETMYQV